MPSSEGALGVVNQGPYKILVIGGSYAGLGAITSLLDVAHGRRCRFAPDAEAEKTPRVQLPLEITLVDERDGYYHLIGSPLVFADESYASTAWRTFDEVPAIQHSSVNRIHGTVLSIDTASKTTTVLRHESTEQIGLKYDYLICATGLSRTYPSVPQAKTKKQYLAEIHKHIDAIRQTQRGVVIIGGGAVGVEMAAELKVAQPHKRVTLIHSRDKLLSSEDLPDEFKDHTLDILQQQGVEAILEDRVMSTDQVKDGSSGEIYYRLTLKDGRHFDTGFVINAISGFHPTSMFLPQSALDEQGYIKIHPSLSFGTNIPNAAYHFAAGDISRWSGIKRCGAAMHQGHFAGVNVYLHILQEQFGYKISFLELDEVPPMMGLAVGHQAVTYSAVEGVKYGEDRMKLYFGDDLGYSICWNYMQLGKAEVRLSK